jgi:hypothetical protein
MGEMSRAQVVDALLVSGIMFRLFAKKENMLEKKVISYTVNFNQTVKPIWWQQMILNIPAPYYFQFCMYHLFLGHPGGCVR